MKPERDGTPVLITDAAPSHDEALAARKRKYLTLMTVRMTCIIVAGLVHSSWWLAVAFVLLSIPLPWIAVLIANDRVPRKVERTNRRQPAPPRIEAREHPVIDERA